MRVPILAAVILAALAGPPAQAIVPDPPPRVCTEFDDSDAVFIGDVLSERREGVTDANIDYAISWRVRVVERFKGSLPRVVTVHTSDTSAREELDVGRRHIIFAFRAHGGRLNISGGGNTRPAPQSASAIAAVRRHLAHPPADATIAGQVVAYRRFLEGTGPLRLEFMNSDGEVVRGRSDREGRFSQVVRPGVWRVRVAEPGWTSERGDYSYQDVENIRLTRGGCTDIQILARHSAARR